MERQGSRVGMGVGMRIEEEVSRPGSHGSEFRGAARRRPSLQIGGEPDAARTTSLTVVPKARRIPSTVSRSTLVRLTERRAVSEPLNRVDGAVSGRAVPARRWPSARTGP